MAWLFRIFFGLILVCGLIALAGWVKNLLAVERSCKAVVQNRSKRVFPVTIGSIRKDRTEYQLTFFIPEENRTRTFEVSAGLYDQCPVGTGGVLTYRGARLRTFQPVAGQASG